MRTHRHTNLLYFIMTSKRIGLKRVHHKICYLSSKFISDDTNSKVPPINNKPYTFTNPFISLAQLHGAEFFQQLMSSHYHLYYAGHRHVL